MAHSTTSNISPLPSRARKNLTVWLSLLMFAGFGIVQAANVNSITNGNWTAGGTWNTGSAPNTGSDNITVDHAITVNTDITLSGSATLSVNWSLLDPPGGSNYNLTLSTSSNMTANANVTFGGALVVQNNATLTINSGDTLRVGSASFTNNSVLVINSGGVLIVYGNMTASNNNGSTVNGKIIVYGNITASNNATFVGSGSVSATGTTSTNNGATFFGSQGSCSNCTVSGSSPLPVELIYFSATTEKNQVILNWASATETNNDHFTIERSQDALKFEELARIDSKAENGNSLLKLAYSYSDTKPLAGTSYYRLKQTDHNGKFETFDLVSVSFIRDKNITFTIYPNPNSGEFNVDFTGIENNHIVQILLYDLQGREVHASSFYTEETLGSMHIIPKEKLSKGAYTCCFIMEGIKYSAKVLVN